MKFQLLLLLATVTTTTWAQSDKYAMKSAEMFQKETNRQIAERNAEAITGPAWVFFKYLACDGIEKDADSYAQALMSYGPIGKVINARWVTQPSINVEVVIYEVQYGKRTIEVRIRQRERETNGVQTQHSWYLDRAKELKC